MNLANGCVTRPDIFYPVGRIVGAERLKVCGQFIVSGCSSSQPRHSRNLKLMQIEQDTGEIRTMGSSDFLMGKRASDLREKGF